MSLAEPEQERGEVGAVGPEGVAVVDIGRLPQRSELTRVVEVVNTPTVETATDIQRRAA